MDQEMVTMVDNRNLRAIVHDITGGVFLTKAEYIEICKIIEGACDRSIREYEPPCVEKSIQEKYDMLNPMHREIVRESIDCYLLKERKEGKDLS